MSNCPPGVFANVMGAPLCKSCGKVWGVEDGCVCAEPALPIPKPNLPVAEDFATIAQRMKEIEAERSKPADASVTFQTMIDGAGREWCWRIIVPGSAIDRVLRGRR